MGMNVIETSIPGVVIIEPRVFGDSRGYFFESWSQREFDEKVRPVRFVQDNESRSSYGVLRGLHFQKGKDSQSKLVRVVSGRVLDVAVDIRVGSPTFGRSVAVELTGENHRQFFIPRGFAHEFSAKRRFSSTNVMLSTLLPPRPASPGTTRRSASTGASQPETSSCRQKTQPILSSPISAPGRASSSITPKICIKGLSLLSFSGSPWLPLAFSSWKPMVARDHVNGGHRREAVGV